MLGLTYQDGVMLATDTLASYGSLARFMDNQRLTPFGSHVVVGASGDMSDWQNIQHTLTKLMEKEDSSFAHAANGDIGNSEFL